MEEIANPNPSGRAPIQVITDLKIIASKTRDLPPLPAVALKAIDMTRDPKATARDLQTIISRDQALTATILRIVNSAMYCLRREVSTISHAIALLGLETVRAILMASSVYQVLRTGTGHDLGTKLLSDHSWGAAVAARSIAVRCRYENPEEAFLSGLLHDIGKLVLSRNMPQQYAQILSDVYAGGATFHEAELYTFGFSHAHVGAILAAKWNFPQQLAEAIMYHHNPTAAPVFTRLAYIANLANLMMISMEIGFEKNKGLELSKEPAAESLKLSSTALRDLMSDVQTNLSGQSPF